MSTNPLYSALTRAKGVSPDHVANVLNLSRKTGLDVGTVERNLPEVKGLAEFDTAKIDDFMQRNPKATSWLSAPEKFALAKDDLDNLGGLEQAFTRNSQAPDELAQKTGLDWLAAAGGQTLAQSQRNLDLAELRTRQIFGDVSPGTQAQIDALKAQEKPAPKTDGLAQDIYVNTLDLLPQFLSQAKDRIYYGLQGGLGAGGAAAIGSAMTGPAAPGAAAISVPTAFATGFGISQAFGGAKNAFTMEAGGAYDEYKDIQGIDDGTAKVAAFLVGAANAGIEYAQFNLLLKTMPGGDTIKHMLTRQGMREALAVPTVRAALSNFAAGYGKTLSLETGQEVLQEAITFLGAQAVRKDAGQDAQGWGEFASRMADTAYQAGTGFALLTGSGHAMQLGKDSARARQAQRMGTAFDEISKFTGESKLNARMPEAYQDYVEHVRRETGGVVPEKVYVSAQRLAEAVVDTGASGGDTSTQADAQVLSEFFQSIGVAPEEAQRAAALNQDVAIPFALYQSKIAPTDMGTALANDIRFTHDGMTRTEAVEFEKEFQGRVQTELAAQEQNRAQHDADLGQAINEYKGELARVGMKGKDADAQLQLLTAGANVAAARWSAIKGEPVTPAQWLRDMRGLQIRAVEQGQAQQKADLEQGIAHAGADLSKPEQVAEAGRLWKQMGTESPYFKKWFGDSKVVDAQGKPLVVHHGTAYEGDIDVFKQGYGRRGAKRDPEYAPSIGIWFTGGGRASALDYGYNISEHYLTLRNPADFRDSAVLGDLVASGALAKFGKDVGALATAVQDGTFRDLGEKSQKIQNTILRWAKDSGYDGAVLNDWSRGDDHVSYIAFSPTQIKSIFNRGTFDASDPHILMQNKAQGSRGGILFTDQGTFISLFKKSANLSTLSHELGHLFINDMEAMVATGNAPESVVKDLETLRAYAGGDLSTKEAQETLARSFEAYLREGQAPSAELRTAFQRFAAWLTAIYRDIRSLVGPDGLSDEVRGVFDRMLASEDEIAGAEAYYNGRETLENVASDMLSDAEKKRISELRGTSHAEAFEKRAKRYVSAYLKALGGKAEFERQAGEEVDARPVYANIKDISENGGLPRAALDDLVGQEQAQKLFLKFPGLVSAREASLFGSHDLDLIAAGHDYQSADDMVAAFQKAMTRGEAVRNLTAEKMAQEEARLREALANETVPGDEDVHSDATLERLAMEAKALERKIGAGAGAKSALSRPINAAASREVARSVLGTMTVADARSYSRFASAERRTGLEAIKAVKAQKWEEALTAKQREAINHALVLEAVKLREEVVKEIGFARRIGNSKSMRFEAKEQALSVIEAYGLGTGKMVPERPTELTDLAGYLKAAFDGDLFNPFDAFPDWLLRKEKSGPYRELSVSDFREVAYLMRSLADIGGSAAIRMATEDVSYEAKAAELAEVIRGSGNVAVKYDEGTEKEKWTSRFRTVMSTMNQQLDMFRKADGYVGLGPEKSHLVGKNQEMFERIQAATKRMLGMQQALEPAMQEVAKVRLAFAERFRRTYGERVAEVNGVAVPQIMVDDGRFSWTAEHVWTIARNIGNGGNRRCLIEGLGLSWGEIQQMLNVLTKAELLAVQREGQIIGSHYPEADKTFRQVYLRPMAQRIEYMPLTVQAADGPVQLDGWYFPIKPDAKLNQMAADRQSADILKADTEASAFPPNPRKSFTNARTGAAVPVALSYAVFERGIAEQTRFIAMAPILKDADRVFRSAEYRKAYIDAFGRAAYDQIRPWLKNIATPGMEQTDAYDDMLSKARRGATAYILVGNLKSALKQELGMLPAAKEMGTVWMLRGMKALAVDGEMTVEAINAMDPRMKNREKGFDTEQRELLAKARNETVKLAFGKIDTRVTEHDVLKFGMGLQRVFDRHTTYSVWAGAFLKGRDGLNMGEAEAIDYAYRMVERSQVTNTDAAMNAIQRGKSFVRLFSMFMSESLPKGSRMRVDFNAFKAGKIGAAEYARTIGYELIGPVLFNVVALNLLASATPDRPKDYFWALWNELFGVFPLLGGVSGYYLYGSGPAESPVFTGMEVQLKAAQRAFSLAQDFEDENRQAEMFKALIDVAAYKYKVGNVRRFYETAAEGWQDLSNGETKNPFRLVIRKPKGRE